MAPESASMTPTQAIAALADVRADEERLTARATGLTNMLWGVAVAGIFLAYAAADDLPRFDLFAWVLWAPFVAAGMIATNHLWATQAVYLRREPNSGNGTSLLFTLGFIAVAALLLWGLPYVGADWSTHAVMLIVSGLLAVTMGFAAAKVWCTCGGPETGVAGLAMLAVGVALGFAGWSEPATGLAAAFTAMAAWFGSGLLIARRG